MSSFFAHYFFRHAVEHAARVGAPDLWDRLLDRIERRSFLARQAEHFGDFGRTSEDLERHVLPELIRRGDWERFLHLALVAANLRGLAGDLDEPVILRALARIGRLPLVERLVSQLADPLRRARARAVLAATQPPSTEAFGRLIEGLRADLDLDLERDTERRDPGSAGAWCETLVVIAATVGPDLRARWPAWIDVLAARDRRDGREDGLAERAWCALVEGFLRRGETAVEELWTALAAARRAPALADLVSESFAARPPADPWPVLERLRGLDPALAWRAAVAVLGVGGSDAAATDAPAALDGWTRAVSELGPPPWSAALVEAGRLCWRRLPEEWFDATLLEIGDPAVRAALAVIRFEEYATPASAARALEEVDGLAEPASRLHWALRFLLARTLEPRRELELQAATVVRTLARMRWAAPAGALCRSVDLVARVFPRQLRSQIENVLWTPSGNAEVLRSLARDSRERAVLDELFRRAEDYAAMAGATAAEGFELRREVLEILAARQCVAEHGIGPLAEAAERLLPEEEDGLRSTVARRLAAAGEPALALEAAAGIRSRRLALSIRLEVTPVASQLGLDDLYGAAAGSPAVADERQALAALHELPVDPADLARAHLETLTRKGRQVEALVDLAHHALAHQRSRLGRALQDRPAAVLPLREALGVVESDEWLAALTPELVAVGARLGPARAVAEIQEAVERIVGLDTVAWARRRTVLLQLVAGIESALAEDGAPLSPSRRRRAAGLVEWIGRLPAGPLEGDGQGELRRDWHRLVPWLRSVERRLGVARGRGLSRLREQWSWLSEEQRAVVALCFPGESQHAEEVAGAVSAVDAIRALACRSLEAAPEVLPELVARLSEGGERDELITELIRFAPAASLPATTAARLAAEQTPISRSWTRAWLWLRQPAVSAGAVWPAPLLELVAEASLELDDPTSAPLRRRAWLAVPAESLQALAGAAVRALASGGRPGCEQGLRLFLNVYLAPRMGEEGGAAARNRIAGTQDAERRAARLGGPSPRSGDGG